LSIGCVTVQLPLAYMCVKRTYTFIYIYIYIYIHLPMHLYMCIPMLALYRDS
jgi:hypothetical protein